MPQHSVQQPDTTAPGPVLVHATARLSPLALWHLLSLDAPTVATVWTIFIARCAEIPLPWTAAAAMFVAVWMIYAADRLLDARALDLRLGHYALEERHRFHHHHRHRFFLAMALATLALAWLLPHLAPASLLVYTSLATLLALWMLLIHARSPAETRRLPKELAVGIIFPAAIFIPTVAGAPSLQLQLLPVALLFSSVCTLNCLFLYAWEHPTERARTQAHWTTLAALRHLPQVSSLVFVLAASVAVFSVHNSPVIRLPALACCLSVALLLLLHRLRPRIPTLHLRALADLVLLTPLLLLWFAR